MRFSCWLSARIRGKEINFHGIHEKLGIHNIGVWAVQPLPYEWQGMRKKSAVGKVNGWLIPRDW